MVDAVLELAAIDTGHILVFLPTERDIREAARRLRGRSFPGDGSRRTEILPLYARLSATEQNRIFQPQVYRRVVLATNVAESSLTVPGIRYVVDTGTARISRYAPRSKVQRLPIEEVSRASADQRAGRCGRVAPGVCVRLYSEENYLRRPEFTTPEIQRTNLAAVILRAKALNLGRVEDFPFIDPPRPEAIRDGYGTLFELGAVDEFHRLTDLGRRLSRFPVDPRIGRMILAADDEHCLSETLIVAAALEVQDPRERPHEKRQHADQQHAQFKSETSDFESFLRLWDFYHDAKERLSRSQLRREWRGISCPTIGCVNGPRRIVNCCSSHATPDCVAIPAATTSMISIKLCWRDFFRESPFARRRMNTRDRGASNSFCGPARACSSPSPAGVWSRNWWKQAAVTVAPSPKSIPNGLSP